MRFDFPLVSIGKCNIAVAAIAKHPAETKRGRETWMLSITPVKRGAMIPASRLRADAIPVAVPLFPECCQGV